MDFRIIDWDNITQADFIEYLRQYSNGKRIEQSNVVVKTNLPLLGITMGNLRMIAKQIKKGDYLKYLSHNWLDYYDLTIIYSLLLDEIDDYDLFEKHFMMLSKKADSWATVDSIPSKQLRKKHGDKMFDLALKMHKKALPFQRRFGTLLLFAFIEEKYMSEIINSIDNFTKEEDYYVNMANAWFLCELFIKERTITLSYFKNHNLNKFTINKAIQKCRESFRVSFEDKELLLQYKVK